MKAIYKRELRAYFSSPIGYVVIGVLLALCGYFYFVVLLNGSSSYIVSQVYGSLSTFGLMIIPIITMRSMSDDKKNKTDQALLTAPVAVTSIVLGKFLAAATIYGIAMVASLVPSVIISLMASNMPWAAVLSTVLGSILYGSAMIAIGVFVSSLTESQIIAAIGTFGISILLLLIDSLGSITGSAVVTKIVGWISFTTRYQPFTNGILNVSSIVFFLSVAAVFVFLTARKLESKRWS